MIRKILLFSAFIFSIHAVYAQGEMDAIKLSQNDLTGTARSVSMGGAFGALGGDIGGIAINPAGIGVYKSSEIVGTLNFQNVKTQTEMNGGKFNESKFKVNFDNIGFVTALPTNNDVAPYINFGISYNRLKNFDRKYSTGGSGLKWSMADYMAHRADGIKNPDEELWFQSDKDIYPLENHDWMAVFGYNSYLIGEVNGSPGQYTSLDQIPANSTKYNLYNREKGSISTYDFNMGTTFSDIVSIGLTFSVTDVKYHLYSDYNESYGNLSNAGFGMENYLKTEGSGFQVSPGIIVKPIDELRIGLAYHSPTWYNLSDYVSAYFDYDLSGLIPGVQDNKGWIDTKTFRYDYRMRTPDKWTFSLAGVIGQTAIISADYEYTNYSDNMRVFDEHGDALSYNPNPTISKHYRGASTLRVGAEVRFTPQFSGRVGYAWMQSPFKTEFKDGKDEAMTVGSITQYTLDGDKNYFTYGLGYRFTRNFYTDIAFVMKNQKDDLQAFYTLNKEEGSQMKTNSFQGLLTLGYRF
ncbi:MAG: OmpP1/FadL family transporter [Dysgonomonas sp.]